MVTSIATARHRPAAGRHNRVMYTAEDYIGCHSRLYIHLRRYMVVETH